MPPLPALPNAVKVRLNWAAAGAPITSVGWHMSYSGATPQSADLNGYAADIVAAAPTLAAHWTSDLALQTTEVVDLSSASGATGLVSSNLVGSRTPGGIDASMCVVAHYQINRRYRGGKPRGYWPFGDSGELASRVAWSSAFVAACASDLTTFFVAISNKTHGTTTFGSHISVSYYSGFHVVTNPKTGRAENVPTPRPSPLIDPIVGLTCSTKPGNQRRRL